jgi:hypothetical protein
VIPEYGQSNMKLKSITATTLYSLIAAALYVGWACLFSQLNKTDKVTPLHALLFYYIGTALVQSIPIVITISSSVGLWKHFVASERVSHPGLATAISAIGIFALSYLTICTSIAALIRLLP